MYAYISIFLYIAVSKRQKGKHMWHICSAGLSCYCNCNYNCYCSHQRRLMDRCRELLLHTIKALSSSANLALYVVQTISIDLCFISIVAISCMHHVPLRAIHGRLTFMAADRTASYQRFNLYTVEIFMLAVYVGICDPKSLHCHIFYGKCH